MKIPFIVVLLAFGLPAAQAQETAPPAPAPATHAPQPAAPAAKPRPRQGADMRHCLDLKDNKAIIRCAEPGRKP